MALKDNFAPSDLVVRRTFSSAFRNACFFIFLQFYLLSRCAASFISLKRCRSARLSLNFCDALFKHAKPGGSRPSSGEIRDTEGVDGAYLTQSSAAG